MRIPRSSTVGIGVVLGGDVLHTADMLMGSIIEYRQTSSHTLAVSRAGMPDSNPTPQVPQNSVLSRGNSRA